MVTDVSWWMPHSYRHSVGLQSCAKVKDHQSGQRSQRRPESVVLTGVGVEVRVGKMSFLQHVFIISLLVMNQDGGLL